jgi:hypothetical protein
VLFHDDSPMVGQGVPRGSARRRVAQQAQHAMLAECPTQYLRKLGLSARKSRNCAPKALAHLRLRVRKQ